MDNDMDVGVPVEAVNEPPEVKAEKETRPGKKQLKTQQPNRYPGRQENRPPGQKLHWMELIKQVWYRL